MVFGGTNGEESRGRRLQSEGFISNTQQGKQSGDLTCAFEVKKNGNNVRRDTGLQEKTVCPRCETRNDFDLATEMEGSGFNATECEG